MAALVGGTIGTGFVVIGIVIYVMVLIHTKGK